MILTGIAAVTGECRFLVRSRLKRGCQAWRQHRLLPFKGSLLTHQSASTGSQITTFALAVVLG